MDALAKKARDEKSGIGLQSEPQEDTLLNSLLSQTDDYKLLRDEILNILIAGECSLRILSNESLR
jgi:hypothetical protein